MQYPIFGPPDRYGHEIMPKIHSRIVDEFLKPCKWGQVIPNHPFRKYPPFLL